MIISKKYIGRRKFDASGRPPAIKTGDIIALGRHRLLCGDSSNQETINALLDGAEIETFVYDPEWDDLVLVDHNYFHKLVFAGGLQFGKVVEMFGIPTFCFCWRSGRTYPVSGNNRPFLAVKYCLWYGNWNLYKNRFQWGEPKKVKGIVRGARGYYLAKPGIAPLADLFELKKGSKEFPSYWHIHEKPWPWVAMILANCTEGNVLDPFAGGGTTMIACEYIDRTCYMVEISPEVCERIIERYLVTLSRKNDTVRINGKAIKWYKTRNPMKRYADPL